MYRNIIVLLLLCVIVSCKKYPEDPYTVIFKSPEKRIEGIWIYNSILINGIDSTDAIVERDKWGWMFGKDYKTSYLFFSTKFNTKSFLYYWEFSESNNKLMIVNQNSKNVTKTHWDVGYPVYWEIIALNNKKFKIKSEPINNNVYEIDFYRRE